MFKLINIKIQQILILGFLLYPGMLLSATTDVWVESEKLVNTAPIKNSWFGYRVASNTDTLAIGCPRCDADSGVDTNEGKVFLYKQDLGAWKEIQVLGLTGSVMLDAGFGSSIAINDQYLVIGAPYYGGGVGAVYIYSLQNGSWVPHTTASLVLPASSAGHFGYSLALHKDTISGTTRLLVGSPGSSDKNLQVKVDGAVYFYEFSLNGTPGTPKELSSGVGGDWFGFSLDIIQDRIIVGAPLQDVDLVGETGNVYLYERNLGGINNWGLKEALLPASRKPSGNFGYAVKLENDLAVVSAFAANIDPSVNNNSGAGEVQVYRYNNTDDKWPLVKNLIPTQESTSNHFGASIDIENGKITVAMLRSTTNVTPSTPSAGAVYLFEESIQGQNDWAEIAKFITQDGGGNDNLGSSILLKPKSMIAGAHVASQDDSGAVYVFSETSNSIPEFTPPANLTVQEDELYNEAVTVFDADSDPVIVTVQTLPAWLSFDEKTLMLSGTASNEYVGIHLIELVISDGYSSVIANFSIEVKNVNDAPVFISAPITSIDQDQQYSYTIIAQDVDGNMLIFSADLLPDWLTLDGNVLFGTPTNSDVGSYDIIITASDSIVSVDQKFKLTVNDKKEGKIGFANTAPLQGIEGVDTSISIELIREGGSYGDVSVEVSQFLGLDDASDVEITPSTVMWKNEDSSSKTIVLKIIDDTKIEGQEEILLQLAIASGTVALSENSSIKVIIEDNDFEIIEPLVEPVAIKTLVLPKSMVGKDFSAAIQIVDGTPPYQISWEAEVPGLKFDGSNVSGIPLVSGDYNIKLRVEDSSNPIFVTNVEYVLAVKQALNIDVDKLNYAIADNDYSFQFKATGGEPVYTWKNDSVLPQGLTLQSTGFLSGTPTEAGDHQISLVVEDESGFSTQGQFEIKVLGFGLQNDTPVLPAARVGLEYHAPLLISGGSEPYVCEVVEGDLPGGIDMNACQISGTPATPGDYDFVIGVVDLKNPALGRRDAFILKVREPRALAIANATAFFNEIGQEDLSSSGPGKGHIDEVLTDMTTDAFGNHYVVGHAYNKGNYQVHLLKYTADKTLAWHQVFDSGIHDYIYSVAISPDQSVYIAGFQLEGNRYDGLIVKYSHKGVKEWERTYSGIDNTDNFYGLIASNDAVYVVGESYNGYDFDAIILKYSANGEQQWTQKYLTSNNDTAYKIQLVSCESDQEKDCEALLVAGTSGQETKTGWLLSLNAHDGSYRGDPLLFGEGLIKVLVQDRDGNVIVGGDRTDSGWLIVKVANDLNVLWNVSYLENSVTGLRGIAVDPDGFIYVAGNTRINGNLDAFIGVLNDNGNVHQTFLLEAPDNEYPRSLVIDANLRLIVSGHKETKSGSKFLLWEVDYGGALQ